MYLLLSLVFGYELNYTLAICFSILLESGYILYDTFVMMNRFNDDDYSEINNSEMAELFYALILFYDAIDLFRNIMRGLKKIKKD